MKLLCIAPNTVMHDWYAPGPAPGESFAVNGKEPVVLKNCPEHDDLPNSEGPFENSVRSLYPPRSAD
jgi:hypothetical protein